MPVPNFKSQNRVVSEKSLTEKKKITHRQTLLQKRQNYITPIYFICWGYNQLFKTILTKTTVNPSGKHTNIILTPLNPTFI